MPFGEKSLGLFVLFLIGCAGRSPAARATPGGAGAAGADAGFDGSAGGAANAAGGSAGGRGGAAGNVDAGVGTAGTAGIGNADAAARDTLAGLSVSSGALRPDFDPSVTDYDVTSLNSLYPIDVTATASDPAAALSINGSAAQSGTALSLTLDAGEDVMITVGSAESANTYTVHYVPRTLPALSVTATDNASSGPVLLSTLTLNPANDTYLLMIDRSGAPLYYRVFPGQAVEDFQQTVLPGPQVMYSCAVGTFNTGGWTLGVHHIMDQRFNDVADVQLLPHGNHGALPVEGHDFLLLGLNHYVAMTYVERTVDLSALNAGWSTQARVMNAVVQEVKDGAVIVEWDSADFPSLYLDSTEGNDFSGSAVADYLHMNSIDIDPTDGNFIVSFRHTDSIVKIDRSTAQVLWTLGGREDMFGLTAEQRFVHQHHVKAHSDGSITVFDNGNNAHQTRALRFVLDETTHTVTSFDVAYTRPSNEPQTAFMGSFVPLAPGRAFYGWGGWFGGEAAPSATEVVDGTVVWSMSFTDPQTFSYRALPIASP